MFPYLTQMTHAETLHQIGHVLEVLGAMLRHLLGHVMGHVMGRVMGHVTVLKVGLALT